MTDSIDADALRVRLAAAVGDALQLGELLGAGGFAAVFRAHDPRLQRDVAIKVLDPALGVTGDLEEQFLREARIVAGVEHPHIVPVYAAESRDGLLFLVMRLLPGRPLADRIAREGALAPAEAARIAHEVAEALAFAHQRGVIHRDIKPENVLLDAAGNASVTDFGVSLVVGATGGETTRGMSVGTPAYMSPEQALAEEVDGRSDVYALGVMLFEMLTGRVPFTGRSTQELMAQHIAAPAPKVSTLRAETPAALVELVERMLAKRPGDRPDADEAVRALAAARTTEALRSPAEVRRRRTRRRLVYAGVIAATVVLTVAGVGTLVVKAITGVSRAMSEGDPPALDALGAAIPDSLIAAARAEGSLRPGEVPTFAFVPAHGRIADAMVMTDSVLVLRSPAGARRIPVADATMDLNFNRGASRSNAVGMLIVRRPGAPPDTVIRGLGGLEFARLRLSLTSLSRAQRPPPP